MFGANCTMPRTLFSPFFGPVCYQSAWRSINRARNQSLGDSSKDVRAKADLRFRKAERAATARDQAMNEYAAESERRPAQDREAERAPAGERGRGTGDPPQPLRRPPKKKPVVKLAKATQDAQACDVQSQRRRSKAARSAPRDQPAAGIHFGFLPGLLKLSACLTCEPKGDAALWSHLVLFRFCGLPCCCVC